MLRSIEKKRRASPAATAQGGSCDPVTLEIVRGAVRAAQAEMEALIERTGGPAPLRWNHGSAPGRIVPISTS